MIAQHPAWVPGGRDISVPGMMNNRLMTLRCMDPARRLMLEAGVELAHGHASRAEYLSHQAAEMMERRA